MNGNLHVFANVDIQPSGRTVKTFLAKMAELQIRSLREGIAAPTTGAEKMAWSLSRTCLAKDRKRLLMQRPGAAT